MTDMTTAFGSGLAAEPSTPFASRLGARLLGVLAKLRNAYRIERDLAYLTACDDRMLADIGLNRGEIEGAVRFGRRF